jgi:hypothetical protein
MIVIRSGGPAIHYVNSCGEALIDLAVVVPAMPRLAPL